jgi:adenylosuccinate lyase
MYFSQPVLLALTESGVSREEAYAWVQECAMRVWDGDNTLRDMVDADPRIAGRLTRATLDACFDVRGQLRNIPHIFARTLARKHW